MKRISKLICALSAGAALYGAGCVSAANAQTHVGGQQNMQADGRPHYLQSLPPQAEIDRMSPLEKLVEISRQTAADYFRGETQDGTPPYLLLNNCAALGLEIYGQDVKVYFPLYKDNEDGSWAYIIDNVRVDSRAIREDMERRITAGIDMAFESYKELSGRTNRIIEENVFPNASRDRDNRIEGTSLVYNDVFGLRDSNREKFLQDGAVVIVAPAEIGTWAATPWERNMILYTPSAMRAEAIRGNSFIFAHELVHNNPELQELPAAFAADHEMQAFLMDIADRTDIFRFLSHRYSSDLRSAARVYFGINARNMLANMIDIDFDPYYLLDEAEWSRAAPVLADVMGKLHGTLMQDAYPEYYAFTPWWLMANTHFLNENLAFDAAMAKTYTPMILPEQKYEEMLRTRATEINSVIDEVAAQFRNPAPAEVMDFGGIRITIDSSYPLHDAVLGKAVMKGFTRDEAEVVYHLALQRMFFSGESINYGALTLKNAADAMSEILGQFSMVMHSGRMSLQRIAEQDNVKRSYELYGWLNKRLKMAVRYAEYAENAGNNPPEAFTPRVFDPRIDITSMYNALPSFAGRTVQSNRTGFEFFRANGGEYIIQYYDTTPGLGFSRGDETDFVKVFRKGEDEPCIAAFARVSSNYALIDFDAYGSREHGIFDSEESISSAEQVKELIRSALNLPAITTPCSVLLKKEGIE